MEIKLGSLFDGSGGFCLAGLLSGIRPVWSSEIEPYCLKVTGKRFPGVKQLGNIMDIDGAAIEPVDVITFGSPCILKGSMVHTDSGYKPIEDVTVLDKVLTHTGEYKQVLESRYTGHKPIWELHTMCGRLRATEDHRIYVRKKTGKNEYSDPDFIPLKDLDKEKYFVGVPVDGIEENPMNLTADECWLIGRYVADGYIENEQRQNPPEGSQYNTVVFCVESKKQQEFEENVQKYVFSKSAVSKRCSKYSLRNTRLVQLCENCGCDAVNKTFPQWILDLPVSLLEQILKGYLSGDRTKIRKITTSETESKKLALAVGYAVAKVYHRPFSIYKEIIVANKTKLIEGRPVNQNVMYRVVWRLEPLNNSVAFYENGYIWCPVNAVYPLHYKDAVYDLTVEGDHSFCVENIAVHNCQDLSVAGKQLGIHEGKRSNLFFEAVRIIKEMRNATANKFPRYAVWENVPGAFSSNKGEDFRAVLEALCGICGGGGISVPRPPKERWKPAGCIVGDGFSVAWRVYDAQFWGVPQRRKRIYLIADFASERAGEILFKPESVRRNPQESGEAREDPPGDAERSSRRGDQAGRLNPWDVQSGCTTDLRSAAMCSPAAERNHAWPINQMAAAVFNESGKGTGWKVSEQSAKTDVTDDKVYAIDPVSSNSMKSSNPHSGIHEEQISMTIDTHPDPACNQGGNVVVQRKKDPVITINEREMSMMVAEDVASTLTATDYKGTQVLCYDGQKKPDEHAHTIDCRNIGLNDEKSGTLQAKENGGYSLNYINPVLVLNDQGGQMMDVSDKAGCLRAQEHGHQPVVCFQQNQRDEKPSVCFEPGIMQRDCKTGSHVSEGVASTLRANMGDNQLSIAYPIENHAADSRVTLQKPDEAVQTLTSRMGTGGGNVPMVLIDNREEKDNRYFTQQRFGEYIHGKSSSTLTAHLSKEQNDLVLETPQKGEAEPSGRKYIVRRLTPLECCRLQGFPDWWTDGVEGSDSAKFRMWGNGIALPCAYDVLHRVAEEIEKEKMTGEPA